MNAPAWTSFNTPLSWCPWWGCCSHPQWLLSLQGLSWTSKDKDIVPTEKNAPLIFTGWSTSSSVIVSQSVLFLSKTTYNSVPVGRPLKCSRAGTCILKCRITGIECWQQICSGWATDDSTWCVPRGTFKCFVSRVYIYIFILLANWMSLNGK